MKNTNCKNCGAPLNKSNKCEYCSTIHHYKFETQNNVIEHNTKSQPFVIALNNEKTK